MNYELGKQKRNLLSRIDFTEIRPEDKYFNKNCRTIILQCIENAFAVFLGNLCMRELNVGRKFSEKNPDICFSGLKFPQMKCNTLCLCIQKVFT